MINGINSCYWEEKRVTEIVKNTTTNSLYNNKGYHLSQYPLRDIDLLLYANDLYNCLILSF